MRGSGTFSIRVAVLCMLLSVGTSHAWLITVEITAEVTQVDDRSDILEGKVKVGDIIKGAYTYESSAPDKSSDKKIGQYQFSCTQCGITLYIGGFVFKTDPNNVELTAETMNDCLAVVGKWDRLYLYSSQNVELDNGIVVEQTSIWLQDTGEFSQLTALLSDALPTCAPRLSDWPTRDISISGSLPDPLRRFEIKARLISAALISGPLRVIYVDDDATGKNNGSSWDNAYRYLQDALTDANSAEKPVEIRVAGGIYRPDLGTGQALGDREAAFKLINQVTLKGSYAGLKGRDPNIRNIQSYETILTGDLNGDDTPGFGNRLDNSYHVVSAINTDESACLDGLVISSGSADGWPTDMNSVLKTLPDPSVRRSDHAIYGGGLYVNGGHPVVINCTFRDNFAYKYGGAFYINGGTSRILRSSFIGNLAEDAGGAIYNSNGVLLKGCLLQGNSVFREGVLAILDERSWLVNCTLADNRVYNGRVIDQLYSSEHSAGIGVFNCIIWNPEHEIYRGSAIVSYSSLSDKIWISRYGNINANPCFANPGYWADPNDPNTRADSNDPNAIWIEGDYHLKSQAGRWDPASSSWVKDEVTSPCIDAGDPAEPIGYEPFPNGGIINMGAYGGTAEASKSYFGESICETIIAGDLNGDCKVDFKDFQIMAIHYWLEQPPEEKELPGFWR